MPKETARNSNIRVSRAAPPDAESIHNLERILSPNPWTVEQIKQEIQNPQSHCWIARETSAGELCAYAVCRIQAGITEVLNLGVAGTQQRRGIGRRLLHRMLTEARNQQTGLIELEVRASNSKAIQFYQTNGFEPVGRRRTYYTRPAEDALLMTLHLEAKRDKDSR